jgi:Protein of unknown function (DUF2652)
MDNDVRNGFLVAADISGYTEFLTGSEIDHGHAIVAEVMACLTRILGTSLRVVKYEGDAVLCYIEDGRVQDPNLLLDLLDEGYLAFSDRLFNIERGSTCTCRACRNAPSLDLKYFLHHGQFVLTDQGKGEDLAGPDVILLHRLMKNSIAEKTGMRAYVFATQAALERTGRPADYRAHEEQYEHFGVVAGAVGDLKAALDARRAAREIRVDPQRAAFCGEVITDADPMRVWEYFFDPVKRLTWETMAVGVENRKNDRGRNGKGSAFHCNHGDFVSVAEMVDWKPFDYFTQQWIHRFPREASWRKKHFGPPAFLMTWETERLPDGKTRIRQMAELRESNLIKLLLFKKDQKMWQQAVQGDLDRLADVFLKGDDCFVKVHEQVRKPVAED